MRDFNKRVLKIVLFNVFIALVGIPFFSCASTQFEGTAVLTGRVCDKEGKPVPDYHVYAGFTHEAVTDSGGIFVLRDLKCGTCHLRGGGLGWRGFEQDFDFNDRKSILCIQVDVLESLLPEIEVLIDEEKFSEAEKLLNGSKTRNEKNPVFGCYRKLIGYCSCPSGKKKKVLLSSLESF